MNCDQKANSPVINPVAKLQRPTDGFDVQLARYEPKLIDLAEGKLTSANFGENDLRAWYYR